MRDVDVVYVIEHVSRELDVACAVKLLAERRHGLSVEILPVQMADDYAARNLRPRALVLPFAYRVTDPGTQRFVREFPGIPVLNLAWEELIYKAYEEEKLPADAFTREYVLHHAWGDFHRDRLVRAGVPESHVFVNGQPAYVFYDEPYCRRYPTREDLAAKYQLDPRKRWILFSENYGWAFYPRERVEKLVENGMPRETVDELIGFCDASLRTVLPWFATLAGKYDFEVIVRPRPATLESDFLAVLREAVPEVPGNFHVIKQESVREWTPA